MCVIGSCNCAYSSRGADAKVTMKTGIRMACVILGNKYHIITFVLNLYVVLIYGKYIQKYIVMSLVDQRQKYFKIRTQSK